MDNRIRRVNRAVSSVEATAAIAVLLAVVFYVTVQDNASMFQAQRDARQAVAQLWLENEVALCRVSQPPWVTNTLNNRLSLYTAGGGSVQNVRLAQVGLPGVGPGDAMTEYSGRFGGAGRGVPPASAQRELIREATNGLDGLVFHEYAVTLRVPYAMPDGTFRTNSYVREHRRVFQGN